jgi:hypothetical protein
MVVAGPKEQPPQARGATCDGGANGATSAALKVTWQLPRQPGGRPLLIISIHVLPPDGKPNSGHGWTLQRPALSAQQSDQQQDKTGHEGHEEGSPRQHGRRPPTKCIMRQPWFTDGIQGPQDHETQESEQKQNDTGSPDPGYLLLLWLNYWRLVRVLVHAHYPTRQGSPVSAARLDPINPSCVAWCLSRAATRQARLRGREVAKAVQSS